MEDMLGLSLGPSDKFECQGQRPKVKVTGDKNGFFGPWRGLHAVYVT